MIIHIERAISIEYNGNDNNNKSRNIEYINHQNYRHHFNHNLSNKYHGKRTQSKYNTNINNNPYKQKNHIIPATECNEDKIAARIRRFSQPATTRSVPDLDAIKPPPPKLRKLSKKLNDNDKIYKVPKKKEINWICIMMDIGMKKQQN